MSGAGIASGLGLYGTVAGAVVFSLAATVGGALFQHDLHRAGDTAKGAAAAVRGRHRGGRRRKVVRTVAPLGICVLAVGAMAFTGPAVSGTQERPAPSSHQP